MDIRRVCALFILIVGFFPAAAQTDIYNRCETTRIEDTGKFENWLQSKQVFSAVMTNRLYRIPVVVHIIYTGEPEGEGYNYSIERVEAQIRTLNEDFRRKEGTPGFNSHPDGEDPRIEFVLAQVDPEGEPTNGIVRVDRNLVHPLPGPNDLI